MTKLRCNSPKIDPPPSARFLVTCFSQHILTLLLQPPLIKKIRNKTGKIHVRAQKRICPSLLFHFSFQDIDTEKDESEASSGIEKI